MRVALLTCRELPALNADDQLLLEPLERRGVRVDVCRWDEAADWSAYELVVVRTPWDYQDRPGEFLRVLGEISSSRAQLVNELELMRWNLDKSYLRELGERGARIVETEWLDGLAPGDLSGLAGRFDGAEFVIKPVVGASARDAFRLDQAGALARESEIAPLFAGRPLMAQPFMARVESEGEYSLMLFGGELSHAVLKKPAAGDYRVQEEHGGSLSGVTLTAELRAAASSVIEALGTRPPYARVDLVRDESGKLCLMELELVEPELFFRTDPAAVERFLGALLP